MSEETKILSDDELNEVAGGMMLKAIRSGRKGAFNLRDGLKARGATDDQIKSISKSLGNTTLKPNAIGGAGAGALTGVATDAPTQVSGE